MMLPKETREDNKRIYHLPYYLHLKQCYDEYGLNQTEYEIYYLTNHIKRTLKWAGLCKSYLSSDKYTYCFRSLKNHIKDSINTHSFHNDEYKECI